MNVKEIEKRNKLKESKPLVYKKILKFDEKIKNGESIAILHIQYDYVCNFKCNHCSIRTVQSQNEDKRKLTPCDIHTIAVQAHALGLARFVITGGEPLIFKDLDEIVQAIEPEKFYINCDTNGWLLSQEKAKHLKEIGIDRIQLSIDSFYAEEHDLFRNKPGSWMRAMQAIDNAKNAGLDIFINTVATKQRIHSDEFMKFVDFFNKADIGVYVSFAKSVGAWENPCMGILVDKWDIDYVEWLTTKYNNLFTHLTPAYGHDVGCPAGINIITITQTGDVLPCQYFQCSFGNIFYESLGYILDRCKNIPQFRQHTCVMADTDHDFIKKYLIKTYNQKLPVDYKKIFDKA
jgi:MoaA/NifB/PqqE/SkfB family radical SAM enzyme